MQIFLYSSFLVYICNFTLFLLYSMTVDVWQKRKELKWCAKMAETSKKIYLHFWRVLNRQYFLFTLSESFKSLINFICTFGGFQITNKFYLDFRRVQNHQNNLFRLSEGFKSSKKIICAFVAFKIINKFYLDFRRVLNRQYVLFGLLYTTKP